MPPTFGATVEVAVAKLQDRIKRHAQATVEQEKMFLLSELPLLEDIARGKRGGSWKEHLVEDSPWADVLREAEYHLLGGDEGSMQDRVTPLYSRVQAAWGKYSSVVKQCASIDMGAGLCIDTAVKQRFEQAAENALITTTEAYFVEVLTRTRMDKQVGKMKGRIASMTKKGIDPGDVQPVIWSKVQEMIG